MGLFDAQGITSSPQSQTTGTANNTSTTSAGVASWAQPYVNNMLTATQNLVNQGSAPNALMQQSYNAAANMQTPGQFGQATNIYGQVAPSAMSAGQNYANMATNPAAIQAYMNPYIQQSLAPQLALLNQQQALAGQNINAQAVGQGAFGGNRATLAQGLNAQNYDLARQSAIGQGYNTAFQQAQQAQQFGANLGLQGLNTANQAAAGLGTIGSQQNAANLGIAGLQNQFGLQQYNLPAQLLQFQQGMLSGLPISTQTTTGTQQGNQLGYQAAPNVLSQISGLGTAGVGAYMLINKLTGKPTTKDDPNAVTTSDSSGLFQNYGQNNINSGYVAPDVEESHGGIIEDKAYAKGGKVGSDLADLQLHKLVG
jgi:hypothetical protein